VAVSRFACAFDITERPAYNSAMDLVRHLPLVVVKERINFD
jgi:hypothetical protein